MDFAPGADGFIEAVFGGFAQGDGVDFVAEADADGPLAPTAIFEFLAADGEAMPRKTIQRFRFGLSRRLEGQAATGINGVRGHRILVLAVFFLLF